jgi:hypothetical protein
MARSQVVGGGDEVNIRRVVPNIFNKQSRTSNKRWSFSFLAFGLVVVLKTPLLKKLAS